MSTKAPTLDLHEGLRQVLIDIVGAENVSDEPAKRALYSEDIWSASKHVVDFVVSPRSLEDVRRVMIVAHDAGIMVAPRGGGMSYTSSYIPVAAYTISLDLGRMNSILRISEDDMTVTVEAGCTWAALYSALKPLGLRTPFWGPMSGRSATVGGGISQGSAMLGSGHYGASSDSLVALTVVLANGEVLRTGARGPGGDTPFYRHFGPDLAGLFCSDSGAFGVKAEITLRLIRLPAHENYASFSFSGGESLLKAMAEMSRAGIACEMCAFDPGLTRVRMKRASLRADLMTLGAVATHGGSLGKGLMAAAKVAVGGRSFIDEGDYSLHVIMEGRSAAAVAADLAQARRIAGAFEGAEIENTIAKVIRATPFPALNSILGPAGEAWAPVHGMVSLSKAPALFTTLDKLLQSFASKFEAHGVHWGFLFTTVSTNAITIEPVFYWPEKRRPIHEMSMETDHLDRLPQLDANAAATAIVDGARRAVIDVFAQFGCGHFQIGRCYPYRESRDDASRTLLDAIKRTVDSAGQLNAGCIGFPLNEDRRDF